MGGLGSWIKDHEKEVALLGLAGGGLGLAGIGPLAGLLGSGGAGAMAGAGAASAADAGLGGMGEMAGGLATPEGAAGNSLLNVGAQSFMRNPMAALGGSKSLQYLAAAQKANSLLNPTPPQMPQMQRLGAGPAPAAPMMYGGGGPYSSSSGAPGSAPASMAMGAGQMGSGQPDMNASLASLPPDQLRKLLAQLQMGQGAGYGV